MNEQKNNNLFIYFLIGWTIVCLIQNYFTDASGEEAYYWLFSQHLDWGYLDHPPVTALILKPGYWLLHNNLGLRLGILVLNILTILVLRKTLSIQNDKLFIWIMLGLLPVHLGSLLVKTDVPLIFFTAWFFFLYKNYLQKVKPLTVFLLALSIALLILSKYHGVLVVFFTLCSNFRLLSKKSFWAVVMLSLLFLSPHFYWQYTHDFASVRFHLYNREDLGFKWMNVVKYILMQPVVFGPLIGVMLFAASAFHKTTSPFHRALKFNIVGVFLFFLVSAFTVEIHKHWTSVLMVPLILLGYEYMVDKENWKRILRYVAIASLFIIIPFRLVLAFDFLPKSLSKKMEVLHHWDSWAEEIKGQSNGLPIMFIDGYEQASRYSYLSGTEVHCYNTFDYRETQHDLWPLEDSLQGKTIFAVNRNDGNPIYKQLTTQIGNKVFYRVIENFRSFRKVTVSMKEGEIVAKPGEQITVTISILNNYTYPVNFSSVEGRNVFLNAHFLVGLNPELNEQLQTLTDTILSNNQVLKTVVFRVPSVTGKYDLRFSIQVEGIEAPINSNKYKVQVKE